MEMTPRFNWFLTILRDLVYYCVDVFHNTFMINAIVCNRFFKPQWPMTLATLFAIALFISLGVWQLQRADEKKIMLRLAHELAHQAPQSWTEHRLPKQYQPIQVQGHFMPTIFLLDNQHHDHQFGFDVLSPLLLADARVVMIDRGWVSGDLSRQTWPHITTTMKRVQLEGYAYYPSKNNWLLGSVLEKKRDDLAVIEALDTAVISQFLHKSVYPFIIRLGKQQQHGFVREWAVVAMPPARHYGYAVQWFAMAAVLFILFIVLNFKKKI